MPEEVRRKIRFTQRYTVQDHRAGTDRAEQYKAGRTVTLPERSALHFVTRGVAKYVEDKAKK